MLQSHTFVAKAHDNKIDGILVIKGDPGEGTDSGLIPSTVAKTIRAFQTYLSIQKPTKLCKNSKNR